jgi:hypothetical protein
MVADDGVDREVGPQRAGDVLDDVVRRVEITGEMPIPFIQVVSKRGWGVDRVIVV